MYANDVRRRHYHRLKERGLLSPQQRYLAKHKKNNTPYYQETLRKARERFWENREEKLRYQRKYYAKQPSEKKRMRNQRDRLRRRAEKQCVDRLLLTEVCFPCQGTGDAISMQDGTLKREFCPACSGLGKRPKPPKIEKERKIDYENRQEFNSRAGRLYVDNFR